MVFYCIKMLYLDFNGYRVLQKFFDEPKRQFQIRELSRLIGLAYPSVRLYVTDLLDSGFLEKVGVGVYPSYRLSDSDLTRIYKRNDILTRCIECGLVSEIEKKSRPTCIILYGSAVEGRDDDLGDIDLFVQSDEVELNLEQYEHSLNRRISVLFESNLKKLNPELINNLANGIVLHGFFKVLD